MIWFSRFCLVTVAPYSPIDLLTLSRSLPRNYFAAAGTR